MKKLKEWEEKVNKSQWRLAWIGVFGGIGAIFGATILNPGYLPPIYGGITAALVLVSANIFYVLFKKGKNKVNSNENR